MGILEFTQQERQIFQHLDSKREVVHADPMEVERRLGRALRGRGISLGPTLDAIYSEIRPADPDVPGSDIAEAMARKSRDDAMDDLLPALHEAFGTAPLDPKDGTGLTNAEAFFNLNLYLGCVDDLKKKASLRPDSSPSGGGPPDASDSPTPTSAASF